MYAKSEKKAFQEPERDAPGAREYEHPERIALPALSR